jgi:hypothetical protein
MWSDAIFDELSTPLSNDLVRALRWIRHAILHELAIPRADPVRGSPDHDGAVEVWMMTWVDRSLLPGHERWREPEGGADAYDRRLRGRPVLQTLDDAFALAYHEIYGQFPVGWTPPTELIERQPGGPSPTHGAEAVPAPPV